MKKALTLLALTVLVAVPSFARYIVVLRDGTRYAAKEKWKVINGKAIVLLENGQALQLDPTLIDGPRSEQMTKIGMANASVVDLNSTSTAPSTQPQGPTLGDQIKLRRGQPPPPTPVAPVTPTPVPGGGQLSSQVLEKFDRAYENIGIYEKKIMPIGPSGLRAEMTVDTEDRVFNAISATSFLMVKNAGVEGVQIENVELYMRTTSGGSAGRFQMSRADAEALDKKTISQHEYFVRKVIY